jgi:hypothetical protein
MADEVTGPPTSPPTPPAPAGTPPGAPATKPRGKQLAILLIGGPILAFGGCALFLGSMNFNSGSTDAIGFLWALLFVVGCGMFLVGCMIGLAVVVQRTFYSKKS